MSTLILDKVLSGYNLAKVNDNFERIEKAFNEALLHRDGSKELTDDLDVNSQKLLNVGGIEIGGVDIAESISQLREEWQALFQGIEEYKAAADEILAEAISYGAVDQKSIGNAQRVFTTDTTYAVDSILTLPLPYIVGKNTLKLNLNHYYEFYKGVDYEEVGVVGSTSTTIKLLRTLSAGVELEQFVDGDNDLYSIYSTAEALQTLLTTSYSPESISAFVDAVSDIEELGLEDKIDQLNTQYEQLVAYSTALQTTVADINTKYSTITDMYEDMGTKYSLLETLYPQLLALISDTNFDLDELNAAVGDINDAIDDLEDLVPTIEGYADTASTAATSAAGSATAASESASTAGSYASSAASANTNAQIWAEGADTQVEYIGGEHSAKGWAEIARDFTFGNLEEALGYTVASDSVVVKHTAQTLTPAQALQARTNIGALGYTASEVVNFRGGISGQNVQGQTADANDWYGISGYERIYYNNSMTGADNISNLPKQAPFMLISRTARSGNNPQTVHQTCYTDGSVYVRMFKDGTWENWKLVDCFGYTPANQNRTYRKRMTFKAPSAFADKSAAMSALSTASGQTITDLYPQAVAFCDGMLYVMYWGYYGSPAVSYSGHTILAVFNYSTQAYVRYHVLTGTRNAEALVVKKESSNTFVYAESTTKKIFRFQLDTTNGSTLTKVNDGNESIGAGIFFSYRKGTWCVLNDDYQVNGRKPAGFSLYDDSWNYKGQLAWTLYDFDSLSDYSALDANQMALPHVQGIELGDDGLYIFKGGNSAYDASFPNVSAIGVQKMDLYGNISKSSLCDSVQFRSAVSTIAGGTVSISESEGGFTTDDGSVYSLYVLRVGGTDYLAVFEEFSDWPDATDFSACAFRQSNIPFLCNTPQLPRGKGGYFYNPFTNELITCLDDVFVMMYNFGLDNLSLSAYGLDGQDWTVLTKHKTSDGQWVTDGTYPVCSDDHYIAVIRRMIGNIFIADIKTFHSGSVDASTKQIQVSVANGTVGQVFRSTYEASFLIGNRVCLGADYTNMKNLWNSNGTLQWDSKDVVTIVESGTGYKRYSDGTQECWGGGNTSNPPAAITFPKAFSAEPDVIISGKTGDTIDMQMRLYKVSAVSVSGFTPVATNISATSYSAATYRYYARGTWSAS